MLRSYGQLLVVEAFGIMNLFRRSAWTLYPFQEEARVQQHRREIFFSLYVIRSEYHNMRTQRLHTTFVSVYS